MKSKYIIIETWVCPLPYVFSDLVSHDDFAHRIGGKPISAGFCYITEDGQYQTYGKSISLNLESRPEDTNILNKFLVGD